jgi:hypothetical protein
MLVKRLSDRDQHRSSRGGRFAESMTKKLVILGFCRDLVFAVFLMVTGQARVGKLVIANARWRPGGTLHPGTFGSFSVAPILSDCGADLTDRPR